MELDSGLGLDCKEFEGIACVLIMSMDGDLLECQPVLILIYVVYFKFSMLSPPSPLFWMGCVSQL